MTTSFPFPMWRFDLFRNFYVPCPHDPISPAVTWGHLLLSQFFVLHVLFRNFGSSSSWSFSKDCLLQAESSCFTRWPTASASICFPEFLLVRCSFIIPFFSKQGQPLTLHIHFGFDCLFDFFFLPPLYHSPTLLTYSYQGNPVFIPIQKRLVV